MGRNGGVVAVNFSSALNAVSSAAILRQHAAGWGIAALIIGELFVRFRLIRSVEGSSELFAYKRFEILTGGALLGLTAYYSKTQSYYALASTAFFVLNRLYRSCTVMPGWARLLKGDWEPYDQTTQNCFFLAQKGFHLLQMVAIFGFFGHGSNLSVKNLSQGAVRTSMMCLMYIVASSIMYRLPFMAYYVNALNLHRDAFLAILTQERFQLCLETLEILSMTNFVSFSLGLGARGLDMIPPNNLGRTLLHPLGAITGLGVFICGLVFIPCYFVLRLKSLDSLIFNRISLQGSLRGYRPYTTRRIFFDNLTESLRAQAAHLLQDIKSVFTPRIMKERAKWMMRGVEFIDVLSDFAQGNVEAERIKSIFRQVVRLASRYKIINFADKYPHILTPYALASEKALWQSLEAEQIQQFLLTPELKTLLKEDEDGLAVLSKQVEAFSQKIAELEKIYLTEKSLKNLKENEWQNLFAELKPFYGSLDSFNFTNLAYILRLLPEKTLANEIGAVLKSDQPFIEAVGSFTGAMAGEFVSRLKKFKSFVEEIDFKFRGLEEKLQCLTGDLFKPAYEGLAMLTVKDLQLMLQEWGEKVERGPFLKIQMLLEQKDIRWKGDLTARGILGQGVIPDNSKEALKTRLTNLLHPTGA
jgi:hypothetical protein